MSLNAKAVCFGDFSRLFVEKKIKRTGKKCYKLVLLRTFANGSAYKCVARDEFAPASRVVFFLLLTLNRWHFRVKNVLAFPFRVATHRELLRVVLGIKRSVLK
jgi:hypothetical protein